MQAFKIDILPPLLVFVRERNKKYIFKCIFNLLNFVKKQMAECKIRNFKSFFKKMFDVSVKKTLQRTGRRISPQMILS